MLKKINTQKFRHKKLLGFFEVSKQNIRDDCKILDVGCGPGWFLGTLFKEGAKNIYGCDCIKNLDFNNFQFDLVNLNELNLPYNEAEFDIVFCSDVLEHLENPSKCLREIRRVVKPNGAVYVTIPNCSNILQRLYFVVSGNSKRFNPLPSQTVPHISMITTWIFRWLIKNKFRLARMGGDGFIVHSYLVEFLPPIPLFSFTLFMELRPIN